MNDKHFNWAALPPPGPVGDLPATAPGGWVPAGRDFGPDFGDSREEDGGWLNAEVLFRCWRILVRRRRLIAMTIIATIGLGILVTLLLPSVYRSAVVLQLSRETAKIVNMDGVQPEDSPLANKEFLETQYALLESRSLMEKVVQALNLDGAATETENSPGFFRWLASKMGGGEQQAATVDELSRRRSEAIDKLLSMVDVVPERNSQIVTVYVRSRDPELAAKIANSLAESFISTNLDRRYDATAYARSFLDDRLKELKARLEDSEKELVAYATSESIVTLDNQQSLVSANLASLNADLAKAQSDRIINEQLWKQAENTPGLGLPQIVDSEAIGSIQNRIAELSAEYQQKLTQFKPAFPEMVQLKSQIDELNLQLTAQADLIKASIKARYEASVEQENQLAKQVEQLKSDVLNMRDRSIRYNILQREVDTNKSLYDGLLQRYKEIGIAGGIGASNISIIDRAEVPKQRYSPSIVINLAAATVLGLMLGVGIAFGLELFDDTVRSPELAEEKIGISVLGVIPLVEDGRDALAELEIPRSVIGEAYRSLRTSLQFSRSGGLPKSLLITSSQPGEGKSTTSVALAKSFASVGYRVLLIDADLRRPSLHRIFQSAGKVGLAEYLGGDDRFASQLLEPSPNMTVMPAGATPENPTELLSSPRLHNLIAYASRHFDLIILDGPPILELADAPLLAAQTESTLLVVSANQVRQGVVRTRLRRLQMGRGSVAGMVLTKFDVRSANNAYYYSNYYTGAYNYGTLASEETDSSSSRAAIESEAPAAERPASDAADAPATDVRPDRDPGEGGRQSV